MGLVYADITLINARDQFRAEDGLIKNEEIRKVDITALVDSGAFMLCINVEIQTQLGLKKVIEERPATLADGSVKHYPVVGPVILKFANRQTTTNALVLPGNSKPLLGAIPIEDLDVIIDSKNGELIVNPDHPNYAVTILKGIRNQ